MLQHRCDHGAVAVGAPDAAAWDDMGLYDCTEGISGDSGEASIETTFNSWASMRRIVTPFTAESHGTLHREPIVLWLLYQSQQRLAALVQASPSSILISRQICPGVRVASTMLPVTAASDLTGANAILIFMAAGSP